MLIIALGAHALFEGIALGLMNTWSESLNMMIAIFIHKGAASMSLAISLKRSFDEFSTLLKLMLLFSIFTPIGVSLGLLLSKTSEMIEIVFVSLSGGTFIYVACSEVIVEEFALPGKRWIKFAAFIIGGTIITLLWFIAS